MSELPSNHSPGRASTVLAVAGSVLFAAMVGFIAGLHVHEAPGEPPPDRVATSRPAANAGPLPQTPVLRFVGPLPHRVGFDDPPKPYSARPGTCPARAWLRVPVGARLMNLDWGTSQSEPGAEREVGPAAVGRGARDLWNPVGLGFNTDFRAGPFRWSDGTESTVTAHAINLPGMWALTFANCDDMLAGYQCSWSGDQSTISFAGIPMGVYDFYVYGFVGGRNNNTGFALDVSRDGNVIATRPTLYTQPTGGNPPEWTEDVHYVVHKNVCVSDGDELALTLHHGVQGTGNAGILINGMQIVQKARTCPES